MKKGDLIIIISALVLALLPLGIRFLFENRGGEQTVTVQKDGVTVYSGPARKDIRIAVPGTGNIVRVKDGNAFMEEADCKDKLCIRSGNAESSRPVVCLPNGVTVTVSKGEKEPEYDAVTK